jgi:hypothetical protein
MKTQIREEEGNNQHNTYCTKVSNDINKLCYKLLRLSIKRLCIIAIAQKLDKLISFYKRGVCPNQLTSVETIKAAFSL